MMNEQVVQAVTEIAKTFKAQVKAQRLAHYQGVIAEWQKLSQERGMCSPHNLYPTDSGLNRFTYQLNHHKQAEVSRFLNSEYRPSSEWMNQPGLTPQQCNREQLKYSLKADAQAIAETKAEQEAEDAIQGFIRKMSAKLQGILDAKGDFAQVHVHGHLSQNSLIFLFEDGSAFTVINDIIIKTSCCGKVHNQYPTRFTNVTLGGMGNNMRGISEAWMKRNFKKDQTIHLGRPGSAEGSQEAPVAPVEHFYTAYGTGQSTGQRAEMTGRVTATPETAEAVAKATAEAAYGMSVDAVKVSTVPPPTPRQQARIDREKRQAAGTQAYLNSEAHADRLQEQANAARLEVHTGTED